MPSLADMVKDHNAHKKEQESFFKKQSIEYLKKLIPEKESSAIKELKESKLAKIQT